MKTIDAITTLHALAAIDGKAMPVKFAYAAARNRRKLSDAATVYEEKRKELLQQFGKKDDKGALVIEADKVVLDDAKGFDEAMKALSAEELPIELHGVALADFPKEMDIGVMEALVVAGMVLDEAA